MLNTSDVTLTCCWLLFTCQEFVCVSKFQPHFDNILCAAYAKAYVGDSTNEISKQICAFCQSVAGWQILPNPLCHVVKPLLPLPTLPSLPWYRSRHYVVFEILNSRDMAEVFQFVWFNPFEKHSLLSHMPKHLRVSDMVYVWDFDNIAA